MGDVETTLTYQCICDSCGTAQDGHAFLKVAIAPPAGWFVHAVIADDGSIEQKLFCSDTCAAKEIDGATELIEIANHFKMNMK